MNSAEKQRLRAQIDQEATELDALHDNLRLALDAEDYQQAEKLSRQLLQALHSLQADLRSIRYV